MTKYIIVLFGLLMFTDAYCQDTTKLYQFSQSEIKALANGITRITKVNSIQDSLLYQYRLQVSDLTKSVGVRDTMIYIQLEQINMLKKNDELYKKVIEDMRPKWYDNKFLWFGLGVLVSVTAVVL